MARTGWHKVYLPEIHDVYPGMRPGAAALLAEFAPEARARVAWSIVPNWQDRAPIAQDAAAATEFAALPGTHVLHGWTHSLGRDALNWLVYGHDNRSEFRALGRDEAERRIALGKAAFEAALGAAPAWFCAPRWQLSRPAEAALRDMGFAGHLGRDAIEVYGEGPIAMEALNFDEGERGWVRALAMAARRRAIRRLLAEERPFRLVIHPDDLRFDATRAQLRQTLAALAGAGWRALGLEETIALWREARA